MRFKVLTALVLLIAIPALMFAQQAQQEEQGEAPMTQTGTNVRMSQVAGITLSNQAGDVQGTVADFVVAPSGDITYVVVQFSQPQDASGEYLLPVDQIQVAQDGQSATLEVSADQVSSLQTLQDGNLPQDLGATAAQGNEMQFLASKLQGIEVVGQDGQQLGTVDDAMMNLQQKKIEYIALAPAGVLGLGDQLFAIPVNAAVSAVTNINVDQGQVTVDVSADQLKQMQGFNPNDWPNQAPQM